MGGRGEGGREGGRGGGEGVIKLLRSLAEVKSFLNHVYADSTAIIVYNAYKEDRKLSLHAH